MYISNIRFYIDPETDLPHIYDHNVDEYEVEEALANSRENRKGYDGARIVIGKTRAGRYLKIIYVPDQKPGSIFIITAYELRGKALASYRRRRRRK